MFNLEVLLYSFVFGHEKFRRSQSVTEITVIIIIISLTSIFFQDQSRIWMATSQQHKVDNQPLATCVPRNVEH